MKNLLLTGVAIIALTACNKTKNTNPVTSTSEVPKTTQTTAARKNHDYRVYYTSGRCANSGGNCYCGYSGAIAFQPINDFFNLNQSEIATAFNNPTADLRIALGDLMTNQDFINLINSGSVYFTTAKIDNYVHFFIGSNVNVNAETSEFIIETIN